MRSSKGTIFTFIVSALILIPAIVYAINITVPAAPGPGYWLNSTSTGAYVYIPSSTPTYFYPLIFTNPGYVTSSTGLTYFFPATSTTFLSTTTGNWAGTWQGYNHTDFLTSSTPHLASYNVTSANPFISVATTTTSATLTFSSSSLGLGTAAYLPSNNWLSSSTTYVASNIAGTGIGVSGATGNVTISNTGVTSFNGSTGAVTYSPSSTLASSSWKFDIANATTTSSTFNYTEWTTDQTVNITNILCKDTVATTSLFIFVPTSYSTTTVSSTIASNFACGIGSHSSSTNLTFPINTPIITEVTSTVGTPVSTPVQISFTKE